MGAGATIVAKPCRRCTKDLGQYRVARRIGKLMSSPEFLSPEASPCRHRIDPLHDLLVDPEIARIHLSGLDFNKEAYDTRDFRVIAEPLIKRPDLATPEDFESKVYSISFTLWGEVAANDGFDKSAEYLYELNQELAALERKERRRKEAELRSLSRTSKSTVN